jgi:UDP-glucose 4-epimerase
MRVVNELRQHNTLFNRHMRILVLGGSGFLGSHIVDKFLAEKHDVCVYDLYPERFRRSPKGIKFYTGDFR